VAEIKLEDVTKVFHANDIRWLPKVGARGAYRDFEDKAFVERVVSHETAVGSKGNDVYALDHLNLTIEDGQAIAIVGPSGSGKSTLLRVVAGLESPDEGTVRYDGNDMDEVQPKDRGIGMVFQNYGMDPNMKGEGNLGFFFRIRRRPPEEMMERIKITAQIMGIGFDVLLDRKPGTLSGGQQQRVAIGRCIVRDPSLFLFDEPLSNLDAKLRASTRIEIKRLLRRFSITSIYVTHDQTEAITLGDRIAVMRAGKIEQIGTYQEISGDPVNSFVANFLGLPPMNLLKGWTVTDDGRLTGDMGTVAPPAALAGALKRGQSVTIGFRSEGARLLLGGEQTGETAPTGPVIPAEVLNAEPNFARGYQTVNVQAADTIFGVQAPIDSQVNTGWLAEVAIAEGAVYLFDGETEGRIRPT